MFSLCINCACNIRMTLCMYNVSNYSDVCMYAQLKCMSDSPYNNYVFHFNSTYIIYVSMGNNNGEFTLY